MGKKLKRAVAVAGSWQRVAMAAAENQKAAIGMLKNLKEEVGRGQGNTVTFVRLDHILEILR